MRGPKPQYLIQLVDNEIAELRQLVSSRNAPQGKVKQAKIILYAHEHAEWSNQDIARAVSCSDRMVRKWRRRWNEVKSLDDLPRAAAGTLSGQRRSDLRPTTTFSSSLSEWDGRRERWRFH